MHWTIKSMITGMTSFLATNLDDLVILMLFFARVTPRFQGVNIIAGQYLGILILILASLPGFLFGFWIPKTWLGLLGFVPIVIGSYSLFCGDEDGDAVSAVVEVLPKVERQNSWRSTLAQVLTPPTYQVAAVTVANGGDNIGIYMPLFANCQLATLCLILAIFLIMTAIWLVVASYLTYFPLLGQQIRDYGHHWVPWILIGLGIFILIEGESYRLLSLSVRT